jgi:endoglucanase Acf2
MNEVSSAGCPGLSDVGVNFGLGFYNDHHFHYGSLCCQS